MSGWLVLALIVWLSYVSGRRDYGWPSVWQLLRTGGILAGGLVALVVVLFLGYTFLLLLGKVIAFAWS